MTANGNGYLGRGHLTPQSSRQGVIHDSATSQGHTHRLGVQLYTVRNLLLSRPAETLRSLVDIGYVEAEAAQPDLDQLAPLARAVGLQIIGTHVDVSLMVGAEWWLKHGAARQESQNVDGDARARLFERLRLQGLTYVVTYLPPEMRRSDESFWREFGTRMSEAGAAAKQVGLTVAYHNHAVELFPLTNGRRPFDILLNTWDPALVRLELDVFWAHAAGVDPAQLLQTVGSHVSLVHLKDCAKQAPINCEEWAMPKWAFVPVGAGTLSFSKIFNASESAGVQHFFVEQDHTDDDPITCLARSYNYVRTLV